MLNNENIYKIRPAGRHILTIGKDLIKDTQAAIIELVKNAYDADSPSVDIIFEVLNNGKTLQITIKDYGHGMTRDVVINKWLVPSTSDKLKRKISPKGRILQGRKGVGRYAASLLGDNLLLKTIDEDGNKTEVFLEWNSFNNYDFLDEVGVLVTSTTTKEPTSTELIITGNEDYIKEWTEPNSKGDDKITKLIRELRKLVSPIYKNSDIKTEDDFTISLHLNIKDNEEKKIQIEPYPVSDLYDYRISGLFSDGKGKVLFHNNKIKNALDEEIEFELKENCGQVEIDIRVYDRDKEDIAFLIKRGLKDENGNYLGINETRSLLNEVNGIGVYRNGFRLRPLGDPDCDWLELNKRRIQTPARHIGSNQVIGFIHIQSEEDSGLEEKSARDGLKENKYYESLKNITLEALKELEIRRYLSRRKTNMGQDNVKIQENVEKLLDFSTVKNKIKTHLVNSNISEEVTNELVNIIQKDEEEKFKLIDDISKKIAIYQGQATLGKIINIVLHEGRRPLNFFSNQIGNVNFWAEELKVKYSQEALDEVTSILSEFSINTRNLSSLFKRIDPLAAAKRGSKKEIRLINVIDSVFMLFDETLITNRITKEINCSENIKISCWEQDLYVILTNLIDNSIFWISNKNSQEQERKIIVNVFKDNAKLVIDYKDSGPGINEEFIETGVIFEPEFSTKQNGTGLGLALAGEAASRNNLMLAALPYDKGAYFRLQENVEHFND